MFFMIVLKIKKGGNIMLFLWWDFYFVLFCFMGCIVVFVLFCVDLDLEGSVVLFGVFL